MHRLDTGVVFFLKRRDAGVRLRAVGLKDEQTYWRTSARTSYPGLVRERFNGKQETYTLRACR